MRQTSIEQRQPEAQKNYSHLHFIMYFAIRVPVSRVYACIYMREKRGGKFSRGALAVVHKLSRKCCRGSAFGKDIPSSCKVPPLSYNNAGIFCAFYFPTGGRQILAAARRDSRFSRSLPCPTPPTRDIHEHNDSPVWDNGI